MKFCVPCTKCAKRVQWTGVYEDRPQCPVCGMAPLSREDLQASWERMQNLRQCMIRDGLMLDELLQVAKGMGDNEMVQVIQERTGRVSNGRSEGTSGGNVAVPCSSECGYDAGEHGTP